MNNAPFEKIDAYCRENKKNNCIRDLAYSVYMKQYQDLAQDVNLTPQAIETILLADANMVAHVRTAEDILAEQVEKEIKRIKDELKTKSFWMSVFTGIVGNFAYSILLLIIFVLAKDQISTWLSSIAK